ncbi:MAG: GHKL domain-containing protein [Acetatifactor sp.]
MLFIDKLIDRRIARYQGDLLATHYAEVENMYNQTRGWRHDYRNHIQVLKNYAELGDMEAVKSYLSELAEDLETVDMALKTGNRMADVILNSKISLARSREIQVRADAHVPVKLSIADIDLCIILGNLFDNAIEACQRLPMQERMIRVYMDMKNTQLYISFTNTTAQKKQKKENGRFATTKGRGHGYGLVRMDTIIERYQGYIRRGSEDGAFTTEILLPQ